MVCWMASNTTAVSSMTRPRSCGSVAPRSQAAIMTSQRGTSSCSAVPATQRTYLTSPCAASLLRQLTSQPMQVRSAVLRTLPLNIDDGFSPTVATFPAAWNTRRATVASSLALFDEQGEQLFNADTVLADTIIHAVQDALLDQPFYKAVVRSPSAPGAHQRQLFPRWNSTCPQGLLYTR